VWRRRRRRGRSLRAFIAVGKNPTSIVSRAASAGPPGPDFRDWTLLVVGATIDESRWCACMHFGRDEFAAVAAALPTHLVYERTAFLQSINIASRRYNPHM